MSPPTPETEIQLPFTAYRQAPARRWLRRLLLVTAAGVAAFGWFAVRRSSASHRVVTRHGLQTLREGMSPKEVTGALGPARRASISGSRECSLYGSPTLEVETFTLYEVCYDAQKLVGVTERRFTASPVEPSAAPEAK